MNANLVTNKIDYIPVPLAQILLHLPREVALKREIILLWAASHVEGNAIFSVVV